MKDAWHGNKSMLFMWEAPLRGRKTGIEEGY